MTTREEIAWLARRAGWGLAPGGLDELEALGTDAVIDLLIDPDSNGIAVEASPWATFEFQDDSDDPRLRQEQGLDVLDRWMSHMLGTQRPFESSLTWFWHDHFAVSFQVVRYLPSLIDHLDLLRERGVGDFRELIRAVSTDGAMLVFLDGATSTGDAPNENYGRELMELYTLGIGNYTEDDVKAAAVALTGWVVRRRLGWQVQFVDRRHDDTPQTFLGVSGVDDVDSVVDTAVDHPACPGFITAKMAAHYLGAVDQSVVDDLTSTFIDSGLDISSLGRAVLEAGVSGHTTPMVVAPVPWLLQSMNATGAILEPRVKLAMMRNMGQVPGSPPNVAGFPGAATWLASSATAARFGTANVIAREAPDDSAALISAADGRWDELADLLLRPVGFSVPTIGALDQLGGSASTRPGEAALALALASPDLLIA